MKKLASIDDWKYIGNRFLKVINDVLEWLRRIFKKLTKYVYKPKNKPVHKIKPVYVRNERRTKKKYAYVPAAKRNLPYQKRQY